MSKYEIALDDVRTAQDTIQDTRILRGRIEWEDTNVVVALDKEAAAELEQALRGQDVSFWRP